MQDRLTELLKILTICIVNVSAVKSEKENKNGKKIFEGDIVHCISQWDIANCIVIFEEGEFRLIPEKYYSNYVTGGGYHAIRCFDKEVIGNIHNNSELLESKEQV